MTDSFFWSVFGFGLLFGMPLGCLAYLVFELTQ